MNRKPKRGISDATLAEVFTALRRTFLPSVLAALLFGIPVLLLDKGSESSGLSQFLSELPRWVWVSIAAIGALSFPHVVADILGDFGKGLVELAAFWGTRPFWKRVIFLLLPLLMVGAFTVSILLGLWFWLFVSVFFSNLSEMLEGDGDYEVHQG